MVYLLALDVILLLGLVISFKAFRSAGLRQIDSYTAIKYSAWGMVPAMVAAVPIVAEMFLQFKAGHGGVSLNQVPLLSAWITLIAGLTGLLGYGLRYRRQFSKNNASFGAVGGSIVGLAVSTYFIAIALDQVWFFRYSPDAGTLNLELLKTEGEVRDLQCDAPQIVVREMKADYATYRCPMNIMIGEFTSTPFIPWPSYKEGQSRDLARALRKIESEVTHAK